MSKTTTQMMTMLTKVSDCNVIPEPFRRASRYKRSVLSDEKIAALAEMICRAGDEPATKSAALLVLMAALEHAGNPRALANTAKHLAFTRCGELNFCNIVDAQIPLLESELLRG